MSKEIKHHLLTTLPGIAMCIVTLLIWTLSFFTTLEREVNDLYLFIGFLVGVLLILSPQKLTDMTGQFFKSLINRTR